MFNQNKTKMLLEEARKLLRKAKRNIGRAWRLKEEMGLLVKKKKSK